MCNPSPNPLQRGTKRSAIVNSGIRKALNFLCLFFLLSFAACRESGPEKTTKAAKRTEASKVEITDDLGHKMQVPAYPKRILSLTPSMTEMLFAIVPDSLIIGRTQNCNYPEAALKKPIVNNYPIDLEALLALKPDLVFAVDGIISEEVAAKINELGIPVYFQKYEKVSDIMRGLNDIGRITHQEQKARQVTDSLQKELKKIGNAKDLKERPTVLAVTWADPIFVHGRNTLMSDKIRLAGGENAVKELFGQPVPALTREYILKLNPDVILGLQQEKMEETFFKLYPELRQLKAYKKKRIYPLNDDLTSRPSPRVVESVREISSYL